MNSGREQLADWIDRKEYSKAQAAAAFKIHPVYLWQLLTGKRRPGRDLSVVIEELAGVPVKAWGRAFDKRIVQKGKRNASGRPARSSEPIDAARR